MNSHRHALNIWFRIGESKGLEPVMPLWVDEYIPSEPKSTPRYQNVYPGRADQIAVVKIESARCASLALAGHAFCG